MNVFLCRYFMNQENNSRVAEFVLLGLSSSWELQYFFFMLFNFLYIIIVLGNLLIVLTVISEPALHTPMYIMLSNLSILDVFLATYATPKMIHDFLHEPKTISFEGCMAQIFLLHVFAGGEMVLLVAMAYDRYVAICKPLHYATIMNSRICGRLVICCWIAGGLVIFPPLCLGLNLEFCDYHVIDHFLCDASPVLKISCSDTWFIEQMVVTLAVLINIVTFLCVVMSYVYIINAILKFPSSQQKLKAFSTCSSHLIVVSITYGSCIFIYVKPSAKDEMAINKCVLVLTTSVAPMLNPFIYSLRNKQVKEAFTDLIKRISLISRK